MVFHGDYDEDNMWGRLSASGCYFKVGDLVCIKNDFLRGNPVGIVTQVRKLIHDGSGESYTSISAVIEGEVYTLSARDYELVAPTERKKS